MIPSANSTGDLTWHAAAADNWADHQAAAAAVGGAYSTATGSSSVAADSRYLNLHRHQILDWENAMLLAHHDSSVYDPVDDYTKPPSVPSMHADTISSLSHPRHYDNILSAHVHASSSNSQLSSHNAWGLLNTVCSRSSGGLPQEPAASLLHTASAPYSYESCLHEGGEGLVGYGNLAATGGLYADPLRSSSSSGGNMLGLSIFDQRRLDDIVKRELYTTHDFNSRLGLNLGGRTYFSAADDFAFGRWGKRLRPNSPGCMMQPAPLCQAEGCKADLSMAKHYHRRHKVCEYHSKAATVHIGEQTQRFCQQCSRFHVLSEFDDGKRSCRKRLADHNRRRRKPQPAPTLTIETATEAKDPSQEAPTGSESLQNGTQSSKGSPMQAADDQPITTTASTPGVSSMENVNEVSSNKGQLLQAAMEQEKLEHIKIKAGGSTSGQSQLKSNGGGAAVANSKSSITTELAGTSPLAASLSLGATDISDVKPLPASPAVSSRDGARFDIAPSATKHAVVMPWLQGSKKHPNLQGFPYSSSTNADHNVGSVTDHVQYGEKGTDGQSSSWNMATGMTSTALQAEKEALMMSSIQAGKSGNDAGGHELFRLLGSEKELLGSHKHSAAAPMQANPGSIGTLAFLDHSLEPSSAFLRDAEHRMIQFSSLQQESAAADDQQIGHSLHRTSSNFIFGNSNRMI